MRIVHVLLTKSFAGTERHVLELAAEQAKLHEVHIILHRKGCDDRPEAVLHRVDKSIDVHVVGSVLRQWTFVQVRKCIRSLRPDVVHCHLRAANKSVRGLKSQAACIGTLHIDYDPVEHDHLNGLIAITPWQQARMPQHIRQHSCQIDNWVSGEASSQDDALEVRRRHGIADTDILVGTLGRLETTKRQSVMIEAALKALPENGRIAVIGHGKLYESLHQQYPTVIMPGYSTQPKAWLRAFDVFVSAAEFEPFGLVFLEAMQAGTPIVATASEGARHLASAMNITPVPVEDTEALSNAIAQFLKQGRRRYQYELEPYKLAQKSQQTLAFYQQCMRLKQNV